MTAVQRPASAPTIGTVFILVSSMCFASSGPLGRAAMDAGLSPVQVASARICLAAVVLLGATALIRPRVLRIGRASFGLVVAYGVLGVAGVQLLYFVAVSRLPVGIALLLEYLSPVLVTVWVRAVRRTVLPRAVWLGVALAVLGLGMVGQLWQGWSLDLVGLTAGLATALCGAAYFLLGERGIGTEHPIGLAVWGMVVGAVAIGLFGPLWTIPLGRLAVPTTLGPWHPAVWLTLVIVAVLSTAAAYATGMIALRHLPANVASMLGLVEPVVAIAASWVLLGQALNAGQLAGAALILAGALLVRLTSARATRAVQPAKAAQAAKTGAVKRESPSERSSAGAGSLPRPTDRRPGARPARSDACP